VHGRDSAPPQAPPPSPSTNGRSGAPGEDLRPATRLADIDRPSEQAWEEPRGPRAGRRRPVALVFL
jgi:hypothetical protein